MPNIFKCKTSEAYHIKILAELLSNNLKTGYFQIMEDKITLKMPDDNKKTLIELDLFAEYFSTYKFKNPNTIYMGLNLNHLHKMLKSIKKKDSLQLFITSENTKQLNIKTIPKENTRKTLSNLTIQPIQNIDVIFPQEYNKPIIVSSTEFQKMCKDLSNIGNDIKVTVSNCIINFSANDDEILKRRVTFGENEDSDSETEEEESIYEATFSTDQFSRITKIAGLSTNIQIFSGENLPLLFKTNIGSLGKISVYIKSKELLELGNLDYCSSDDEY